MLILKEVWGIRIMSKDLKLKIMSQINGSYLAVKSAHDVHILFVWAGGLITC